MHTIQDIEDGILGAIRGSSLASSAKTIDTYHGEVDSLVDELKRLTIQLPAIFVLYGGSHFTETANRSYDDAPVFTVVAIARDLRGRDQLRIGMYAILEVLKETLIDNDLGYRDISPLHPISIEPLLVTKEFSVYALDLRTTLSLD